VRQASGTPGGESDRIEFMAWEGGNLILQCLRYWRWKDDQTIGVLLSASEGTVDSVP
jgi:hypothetical protein